MELSKIIPLKQNPTPTLQLLFTWKRSLKLWDVPGQRYSKMGVSPGCLSVSPSHPPTVSHLPLPVCPSVLPASSESAPRTPRCSSSFGDHHWKQTHGQRKKKEEWRSPSSSTGNKSVGVEAVRTARQWSTAKRHMRAKSVPGHQARPGHTLALGCSERHANQMLTVFMRTLGDPRETPYTIFPQTTDKVWQLRRGWGCQSHRGSSFCEASSRTACHGQKHRPTGVVLRHSTFSILSHKSVVRSEALTLIFFSPFLCFINCRMISLSNREHF